MDWTKLVEKCHTAGARNPREGISLMPYITLGYVGLIVQDEDDRAERVVEIIEEMLTLTSPPCDPWFAYTIFDDKHMALYLSPKDMAIFQLKLK